MDLAQVIVATAAVLGFLLWLGTFVVSAMVFRRVPALADVEAPVPAAWPRVTVLITACNEEDTIASALASHPWASCRSSCSPTSCSVGCFCVVGYRDGAVEELHGEAPTTLPSSSARACGCVSHDTSVGLLGTACYTAIQRCRRRPKAAPAGGSKFDS
jgi:hypothetical protein